MNAEKLKSSLLTGTPARLVPVVADSKKEERATSVIMAAFMVVPEFSHAVLSDAGAPISTISKVQCLTEVSFRGDGAKNIRPDALIIVTTRGKLWSALIETKVGAKELGAEQIESYLSLAKEHGVDAVITISNQFATLPTHHPVPVNKHKTRHTGLYHFSWLSIVSRAILLLEGKAIEDREQVFILKEIVRYLRHDSSGVQSKLKMSSGWRASCDAIYHKATLRKNNDDINAAVASWHQLEKYLSIQMTGAVNRPVTGFLRRKYVADPALRLRDDVDELITGNILTTELSIPNAAGRILVRADFMRKALELSIHLDAPKDTKRQSSTINWLVRQLKNCKSDDAIIRAHWPRRAGTTMIAAEEINESPAALIPRNVKDNPVSFDIVRVIDMGAKFKSVKAFVELSEAALIDFYSDICQHLSRWIPKAPQVKKSMSQKAGNANEALDNVLNEGISITSSSDPKIDSSQNEVDKTI